MTFQSTEFPTIRHWWHDVAETLAPIHQSIKQSSVGLTQGEIQERLDQIHEAYSIAHQVDMPIDIKAQMIATLCNLMMSFSARYEGQKRDSAKLHRITQVEWVLLQEMLQREGIDYTVLQ
ncbi:MAG: hypothetical protein AAFV93_02575 [Chloroflexota bacterium]